MGHLWLVTCSIASFHPEKKKVGKGKQGFQRHCAATKKTAKTNRVGDHDTTLEIAYIVELHQYVLGGTRGY